MAGHRIARRLRLVAPTSVWIGIDLGQERHAVAVLSPDGRLLARFWMTNARSGFEQLMERARGFSTTCDGAPVVIGMEATNHYWETLVDFLDEHDLAWRLINPFTAKRHREGADLARTKHDRRDALQLAEMLRIGYFTETKRLPPAYAALRRAFHEHVRLADARAQQQILIRHALEGVFPELRRACRAAVQSEAVRSVLRTGLTPREIAALSETEFIARVRTHFHGKRLFCGKLRALYAACQETVGSLLGAQAAMAEIRRCLATFDHLEAQLAEVDSEIDAALSLIPISRHLFTVPGLGRITVAGLLAEIGPIEWYTSGKQLVKLAGLHPGQRDSGRRVGTRGRLSKQGRVLLRRVAFMAALSCLVHNPVLRARHQALTIRPGRPLTRMVALGAAMNKLLLWVFALLHHERDWDPAYQWQPSQKEVIALVS